MRVRGGIRGWKALTRIALVGVMGGGTVACSSDATRLGEPFTNPFSSSEPAATGSLGEDNGEAIPTAAPAIRTPRIRSEALAAPTMSPRAAPSQAPAAGSVSGMNPSSMNPAGLNPDAGRRKVSQAPSPAPAMTPRSAAQPKMNFVAGAKSAEKPTKVAEAKLAAKAVEARPLAKPAPKAVESKPVAKVAEAKPQAKAEPKVEPKADPKKAEAARKAEAEAKLAKAQASKDAAKDAAKRVADAKAAEAAAKAASKESRQAARDAVKETKETKQAAKESPAPIKVASADPVAPVAAAANPSDAFRWPAKGRIINGYGSSGNEGINIAVPEGTPVKAAEEGTVAYAGSDVKGYGKLVLVRHNNGYVSAYAHNGELDVRPGEKVKRGQVIAKSGATGNVTSPQLHFELRKGATPVDPMPHLGG